MLDINTFPISSNESSKPANWTNLTAHITHYLVSIILISLNSPEKKMVHISSPYKTLIHEKSYYIYDLHEFFDILTNNKKRLTQ